MLLGSLPFVLYLHSLKSGPGAIFRDEQVRFFRLELMTVVVLFTSTYWRN